MEKGGFLKSKKLVKNTTIISVWFVVIALISSSSLSANFNNFSEINNNNFELTDKEIRILEETSAGLAPISLGNNKVSISKDNIPLVSLAKYEGMWGYIANSSTYTEGPCYFEFDDPGNILFLKETESEDFLSGGTSFCEDWITCENSTGELWEIETETGDMTYIGGGGVGLNGLAFDPVYCKIYGASGSNLYEINPDDGSQELIGSFGTNVNEMIAIAFDLDGVCYGWDLGDKLWTINPETAEPYEIGPLGIDLNYAQDGGFNWDTGQLWLTAYTLSPNHGSYLYECDIETGECLLIGQFEGNSQITASFTSFCCCTPNDVGVKNIIYPKSGYAIPEIPMQVTVKNYGPNPETTDVQMQVNKFEAGPTILEEDFSVSFPPDGWTTDYWNQSFTNESGGELPEARCYNLDHPQGQYYDSYIMSPCLNCSCTEKVELRFKFKGDIEYSYCSFFIKYRKDTDHPWMDVTPWDNPISFDFGPEEYVIDIYGDPYLGEEFQVKWEYDGYYSYFNYWWLDDVEITAFSSLEEYNETIEDITPEPGEEVIVDFPTWKPDDWQNPDYEDIWQDYIVKAWTLLEDDDKPLNDYKEKVVDLYFPWMHDIEITCIDSPFEDGPGQTYPVQATIKNVGQYAECCIHIDININDLFSEYSDQACQGDNIEPGESKFFNFDDWTPDYMQNETTGSTYHTVQAEIYMAGDKNLGNDMKTEYFTLEYWHDVGIDEVTSPPNHGPGNGDLCWANGEPDGRNGLACSMYQGYSNIIIDDCEFDSVLTATGGHFRFVWGSGNSVGNLETVKVYFFEETGNCEPSEDEYAIIELTDFEEYATGDYYFSRPEIAVDFEFDEVELDSGKWWVGFQPDGIEEDIAYMLTTEGFGCSVMADLPYWGYPRWSSSNNIWNQEYDFSWQLYCYMFGCPSYYPISAGTKDINVTVKNYGTFPELDLTCNAKIWEYITDPSNGTLVYEDNISDIDLDIPLDGELYLLFDEFYFEQEGRYGLYLNMPDDNDDYSRNNIERLGLGVDATGPISTYELDPPEPDGENGWYVDDVEVTLEAMDPSSNDVSSGVKEIKYRVNDGPVETIERGWGYFLLTQEDDGEDVLVEYWAIDNVDNEETSHNTFNIDMDLTNPTVDLVYEVIDGNPVEGWKMLFTATATDVTSGIDYVEFFFNGVWQETVKGPGPIFEWSFIYHGGLNIIITVVAYDKAGNSKADELDKVTCNYNLYNQQQSQIDTGSFVTYKTLQKLLGTPGGMHN